MLTTQKCHMKCACEAAPGSEAASIVRGFGSDPVPVKGGGIPPLAAKLFSFFGGGVKIV